LNITQLNEESKNEKIILKKGRQSLDIDMEMGNGINESLLCTPHGTGSKGVGGNL
jgi:hypothetical protein